MSKKTDNSNKKKLFGRNLFTFCIIFGGILILLLGGIIFDSYYGTYKDNEVTAFVTNSEEMDEDIDITDAKHLKAGEFDQFDIYFSIASIENKKTIKFKLGYKQKENDTIEHSDYGRIYSSVCIAADWIGYADYSNYYSQSLTKSTSTSVNSSTSITIDNVISFPQKANTWPVKVEVNSSDVKFYLFLQYSYENEKNPNKDHVCKYIIEYSYNDLINGSIGGL